MVFRQVTIVVDGFSMVFYKWTIVVDGFSMVFHISTIGINGFSNGFLPLNHCHWMNGFASHHWYQWFFDGSQKLRESRQNMIFNKNRGK